MSKDIKFADDDFSINIVTQDKFESETGVKLNTIISSDSTITTDMLGITVNIGNKTKNDNNTKYSRNGTGVLNVAPVKSSNGFLNKVQSNAEKQREAEKKELENSNIEFPYIKASIMTDAEKQLYHFMLNNLCQVEKITVLPKVRLADVINVDSRITLDKNALYKICYKHVDYVICTRNTLDTICVVELDDYTHESQEAKDRDLFIMQALDAAGIPVARIRRKIKSISRQDLAYVDELINKALAPNCPKCGKRMIPRSARDGHRFYACEDFINCRHTQDIDMRGEELP